MAKATSQLHRSLRGAIGDLIFRNYNGQTVVSLRPVYKNETNTEGRRQARGRFREASHYASKAMANPTLKAYYLQKARQLKLPNAYTAALTDYLRKAKAAVIKPSGFSARKGETILIRLSKSVFAIRKVKAALYNERGEILSEQNLKRTDIQKTFHFQFADNFPDYDKLTIITDEPGDREYTIRRSDFLTAPPRWSSNV